MDQDTAHAIADIRQQLDQLRSALGASSPDEAEADVQQLKSTVEELADGFDSFLAGLGTGNVPATPVAAAQQLTELSATVSALAAWAAGQGFKGA